MDQFDDLRPIIELAAVASGATSGALHARRRGYDFIGIATVGVAAALGGGLLRDALLGDGPAIALRSPAFLVTGAAASIVAALLSSSLGPLRRPLWIADSLALGLFSVAGLQRAQAVGLGAVPSLFLGVMTNVGGGLIRDILCRETPALLLPGRPYAVTAIFAGSVYLVLLEVLRLPQWLGELGAVAAGFGLRALAAWRGWHVPVPPDLPDRVRTLRQRRRAQR